jgi:lipoprotein-anchoring transpeptidase ErfK/SrfK
MRYRLIKAPRLVLQRPARLAMAAVLAALIAMPDANAARRHGERRHAERTAEAVAPRPAGTPIMAIVSIKSQRITIYDADGWILRAPVSTGTKGRETPAGVFSVIQKEKDHYSNLYDDAYMPHMHRITWSGIALHGGPLPGHPASHGCIRLPYGFAGRLFETSPVGMRVIIAPGDAAR